MTARELIEELSRLPPEAEVRVRNTEEYVNKKITGIDNYEALGEYYIDLY